MNDTYFFSSQHFQHLLAQMPLRALWYEQSPVYGPFFDEYEGTCEDIAWFLKVTLKVGTCPTLRLSLEG
jgi:hypothetical protein